MKYFEENEFISEEIIQIFFEGNKLFELLCFFTFKENEKLLYSSLRALKALFKFPSLSHINFSSVNIFFIYISHLHLFILFYLILFIYFHLFLVIRILILLITMIFIK